MTNTSIVLSRDEFRNLPEVARAAILALFDGQPSRGIEGGAAAANEEENGLARLDEKDAKEFLNTCRDKTREILKLIVDNDGRVLLSQVCFQFENTPDQLKGAWSGLTKRVRTVTRRDDAKLINWFRQGDDWRGVMAHKTVASMRVALEARG